jgi:hypothetical protein
MRPLTLCRERLLRIQTVLNRVGGEKSLRDLMRSFAIRPWELEQAAALGWLKLYVRPGKGGKGRPSRVAELIPQDQLPTGRSLPPYRNQIPREIGVRHQQFAMRAVWLCVPWGIKKLGLPGIVTAYIITYHPRSYVGARASASRLMRHPHVKALMQWHYAKMRGEIPAGELMPPTEADILVRLRGLRDVR